jgi:pimeloyl-ACP methyl ester carboxylesterase
VARGIRIRVPSAYHPRTIRVPDARHLPWLDDPQQIVNEIERFLTN